MATSFDTPIVIAEVADGKFRVFRGEGLPADVSSREPIGLGSLYQIRGPLEAYYRLVPLLTDVSRDEVLAWLQGARLLGCEVREVESSSGIRS